MDFTDGDPHSGDDSGPEHSGLSHHRNPRPSSSPVRRTPGSRPPSTSSGGSAAQNNSLFMQSISSPLSSSSSSSPAHSQLPPPSLSQQNPRRRPATANPGSSSRSASAPHARSPEDFALVPGLDAQLGTEWIAALKHRPRVAQIPVAPASHSGGFGGGGFGNGGGGGGGGAVDGTAEQRDPVREADMWKRVVRVMKTNQKAVVESSQLRNRINKTAISKLSEDNRILRAKLHVETSSDPWLAAAAKRGGLSKRILELEQEINKLRRVCDENRSEKENLHKEMERLKTENMEQNRIICDSGSAADREKHLMKEIDRLQQRLNTVLKSKNVAEAKIQDLEGRLMEAGTVEQKTRSLMHDLQDRVDKKEREVQNLKGKIRSMKETLTASEQEIASMLLEFQNEKQHWQEEVDSLRRDLVDSRRLNRSLMESPEKGGGVRPGTAQHPAASGHWYQLGDGSDSPSSFSGSPMSSSRESTLSAAGLSPSVHVSHGGFNHNRPMSASRGDAHHRSVLGGGGGGGGTGPTGSASAAPGGRPGTPSTSAGPLTPQNRSTGAGNAGQSYGGSPNGGGPMSMSAAAGMMIGGPGVAGGTGGYSSTMAGGVNRSVSFRASHSGGIGGVGGRWRSPSVVSGSLPFSPGGGPAMMMMAGSRECFLSEKWVTKLREVTGENDVENAVRRLVAAEEANFGLLSYVSDLVSEEQQLQILVSSLRKEVEEQKESVERLQQELAADRSKRDVERSVQSLQSQCDRLHERCESQLFLLTNVKAGVQSLAERCGITIRDDIVRMEVVNTQDGSSESTEMRLMARPHVSDINVVKYLSAVEEFILGLRSTLEQILCSTNDRRVIEATASYRSLLYAPGQRDTSVAATVAAMAAAAAATSVSATGSTGIPVSVAGHGLDGAAKRAFSAATEAADPIIHTENVSKFLNQMYYESDSEEDSTSLVLSREELKNRSLQKIRDKERQEREEQHRRQKVSVRLTARAPSSQDLLVDTLFQ